MKDRSERRGSPRPNRPHPGPTRTRNGLLALALISAVVLLANGAWAAETITVPIGTEKGDNGEIIPKGTVAAAPGDQCTANVTYTNNEDLSEHNTDVLVGPVVFADAERGAGRSFEPQTFTAAGPVVVSIRIWDGITSGGFTVGVTCNPPEHPSTTTTTTMVESSTTTTMPPPNDNTPPTSTVPPVTSTTPTVPVPVGVDTGRGAPPEGGAETGAGACADPPGVCFESPWWLDHALLITGLGFVAALAAIGAATYYALGDGR